MNKRLFALVAAVITFSVGVVIARLSLPTLHDTVPPQRTIQFNSYRLSGPYKFEKLSIFLVHGPNAPDCRFYTSLQDAVERGIVTVHETNHVNELAIENVSHIEDVFVQAGDIVKGGRQDRVLSVDLVLPANSGIVPISAFCVEESRWQQRGAESVDQFTLTEMSAPFSVRRALREVASQIGVWKEVYDSQEKLSAGVQGDVRSEVSPTSLPLALESERAQHLSAPYVENLSSIIEQSNDVIGFAFAVNDQIKGADIYFSEPMFKQFWPRLLKAAAVEAIAEPAIKRNPAGLTIESVREFLINSERGEETVSEVNARTRSVRREAHDGLYFETIDLTYDGAWVHRSYLSRVN